MFGLFKKKSRKKSPPALQDLDGKALVPGDMVTSLRYELGLCELVLEGMEYFYLSQKTKQKVSYVKMIDAITGFQKVRKVKEDPTGPSLPTKAG